MGRKRLGGQICHFGLNAKKHEETRGIHTHGGWQEGIRNSDSADKGRESDA
jgi:hypothetical protein